jgi:hypothetical protein
MKIDAPLTRLLGAGGDPKKDRAKPADSDRGRFAEALDAHRAAPDDRGAAPVTRAPKESLSPREDHRPALLGLTGDLRQELPELRGGPSIPTAEVAGEGPTETEGPEHRGRKRRHDEVLDAGLSTFQLPLNAERVAKGIGAEHNVASRALLDATAGKRGAAPERPEEAADAPRDAQERHEAAPSPEEAPAPEANQATTEPAREAAPTAETPASSRPDAQPTHAHAAERPVDAPARAEAPQSPEMAPREASELPFHPSFQRIGEEQLRVEIDRDLALDVAVRAGGGVEVTAHGTPQALNQLAGMDADLERSFNAEGETLSSYSEREREPEDHGRRDPDGRDPRPQPPQRRGAWRGLMNVVA